MTSAEVVINCPEDIVGATFFVFFPDLGVQGMSGNPPCSHCLRRLGEGFGPRVLTGEVVFFVGRLVEMGRCLIFPRNHMFFLGLVEKWAFELRSNIFFMYK